jgi:hypothetical protein
MKSLFLSNPFPTEYAAQLHVMNKCNNNLTQGWLLACNKRYRSIHRAAKVGVDLFTYLEGNCLNSHAHYGSKACIRKVTSFIHSTARYLDFAK